MKEKKKVPIIYGTRIAWARYRRKYAGKRGYTVRTIEAWMWHDGTYRVYIGGKRSPLSYSHLVMLYVQNGWELVAGGC